MNTILLATDFSDASDAAFRYSLHLADHLRAKLVFLHVEHIPATDIQASGGMLEQVMQHRHKAALEGLNKMKLETAEYAFANNTHIESDHILTTGMIVEEILHAAKALQPNFVIVGTPSKRAFHNIFSGDITAVLIRKLHFPLIIVPENQKSVGSGDILFATGWDSGDDQILDRLLPMAAQLRTNIRLLHVSKAKEDNKELAIEAFVREHYAEQLNNGKLRSVVSYSEDITDAIEAYILTNQVSIIVAGHHHHLIESFHRQIARELIAETGVPVLIYQLPA
jgi:nucleotide-binding universal stress UspA family protein